MGHIGLGTKFQRGSSPVDIASVESISGPNLSLDMEEITNLSSEDGWEEYIGAVLRTGEITLALNFIPENDGHQDLISDMVSQESETYTIVFVDDSGTPDVVWEFDAFVTGFSPTTGVGKITANVTFKPTGDPDLDLGS